MQDTPGDNTPGTGGPGATGSGAGEPGATGPGTGGPTGPGPSGPVPPVSGTKGTFERAKDIIVQPKSEWERIDAEPATVGGIYTSYVMILAAIGPVAILIGHQLVGISWFGVTWRPPMGYSIAYALATYVLSLVSVYIVALIIDALAPSFGGTKNQVSAFKVAAYAATPGWLAGILYIIPALGMLVLIGALYGLYLLYLGLPRLMRVGQDKAVGYTVVVVLAEIVLFFLIGFIVVAIAGAFFNLGAIAPGTIRY